MWVLNVFEESLRLGVERPRLRGSALSSSPRTTSPGSSSTVKPSGVLLQLDLVPLVNTLAAMPPPSDHQGALQPPLHRPRGLAERDCSIFSLHMK